MTYTKKQRETMGFIQSFSKENGIAPSFKEMSEKFEISIVSIHERINALVSKGAILKVKNQSRAIKILDDDYLGASKEDLRNALRNALEGSEGWENVARELLGVVAENNLILP